jgi:hypothetical protein
MPSEQLIADSGRIAQHSGRADHGLSDTSYFLYPWADHRRVIILVVP